MSGRTEAALRASRPGRVALVSRGRLAFIGRGDLLVAGPAYDPCFMPVGHGELCCLPGTHTGSCLPKPATYPPTVTVAVAS